MIMDRLVIDCATGEAVTVPLTQAEQDQRITEEALAEEEAAEVERQRLNQAEIERRAEEAITDLRAYLGRSSPTAAQTTAVVKVLCRVVIGLVRLQLRRFESAD